MSSAAPSPLPIPFGWYCVGYGDELDAGELRSLHYFGRDLVLFRSVEGIACLVGAHCPHLGAHLGGGHVDARGLHCPFHDWTFDTSGRCVDIPYASRIPPAARDRSCLETLPVVEQNGFLWAWYHPGGCEPLFPLQEFEEISSGEWADFEKYEWEIASHPQETGENAVDSAHFLAVHAVGEILARPKVRFEGHLRFSDLELELTRITEERGREPGRYVAGHILTANSGPGQSWTRQVGIADLLIIGLVTPIEEHRLQLRFACSVPKSQVESHGKLSTLIIRNAVEQVEQDIPIWQNKIYLPTPILCDGDGPIARYREWFSQFYA